MTEADALDEGRTGESHIQVEQQEFEVWWRQHPEGLIYALVRSKAEAGRVFEPGPKSTVVSLVYDERRRG